MTSLPGLFISHGAPTLAIEANPTAAFLRQLSAQFARPEAILCISAHWETQHPALSTARHPQTIHDFYGFPPELYHLTYPAPGSPQLAEQAADLLQKAGVEAKLDPLQGLDHGAWEPLMLMYPEADIPVVQLSVQPHLDPHHHFQMGQALEPLRHKGILIVGSGSATHNLRELRGGNVASSPPDWVTEFDQWLTDAVTRGDIEALLNYRQLAPYATRNHPTDEHLLPLFVVLGAGGTQSQAVQLHTHFTYGILSMAAYAVA